MIKMSVVHTGIRPIRSLTPSPAKIKTVRSGTAYRGVMDDVLRRIGSDEWPIGTRIPTIDQLERLYTCSRMTIFRAIRELCNAGFLVSRGRAGTFAVRHEGKGCLGVLSNYDFAHPEQSLFSHALTHALVCRSEDAGFHVRLYSELSSTSGRRTDDSLTALQSDISKGLLSGLLTVASNAPRRESGQRIAASIPCVHINFFPDLPYRVYIDYGKMVVQALAVFRQAKRRRVALIHAPEIVLEMWRQEVRRLGLHTEEAWMDTGGGNPEEIGYRRLMEIWTSPVKPDAVLVVDDVAAKGVAYAAMALGISVPQNLYLMTLANRGIDCFYPCPMGRLELDPSEMAAAALNLLQRRFAEPGLPPCNVLVPPNFQTGGASVCTRGKKRIPVTAAGH